MTEPTCLRCGLCCHFMLDGVYKRCRYLVKLRSGKTACRIYGHRLNKVLAVDSKGKKIICRMRADVKYDYEGCPYNTNKPIFNQNEAEATKTKSES